MQADGELIAELVRIARSVAGGDSQGAEPRVLSRRSDGLVVSVAGVVVKAHRAETDRAALLARLRVAAAEPLAGILLPPLPLARLKAPEPQTPLAGPLAKAPLAKAPLAPLPDRAAPGPAGPEAALGEHDMPDELDGGRPAPALDGLALDGLALEVGGRLVTAWPAGVRVDADDPDAAPWEQAAMLLARLHDPGLAAVGGPSMPVAGGPARLARAMARLGSGGGPAGAEVRRAFALLPPAAHGGAPHGGVLVHGDWHLGQLVRLPDGVSMAPPGRAAGPGRRPGPLAVALDAADWRLIDVEDLGIGDPAWDLGRPAAWFAAGLLPPAVWDRFLSAYRAAGGSALPRDGDPWQALDVPARALAVQAAALAVAAADREGRPLDEVETALVDACRRIIQVYGTP